MSGTNGLYLPKKPTREIEEVGGDLLQDSGFESETPDEQPEVNLIHAQQGSIQ